MLEKDAALLIGATDAFARDLNEFRSVTRTLPAATFTHKCAYYGFGCNSSSAQPTFRSMDTAVRSGVDLEGQSVMRVVSWNIRHGGGRRRDAVHNTLVGHAPNIIVLTEYRSGPGLLLLKGLAEAGWPHVATSNPAPRRNGIAVVSRRPFTVYRPPGSVPPDRWVEVEVPDYGLALAAVYVPIRGNDVKPKDAYWRAVLKEAATRQGSPFLFVGDWNTGDRIGDAEPEGRSFSCSEHFAAMAEEGFVEAWRLLHPHQSAFSWYSRRRGADGNGFRIDHAFLSEQLRQRLVSCEYSDIERAGGISDHAALVLNLRF